MKFRAAKISVSKTNLLLIPLSLFLALLIVYKLSSKPALGQTSGFTFTAGGDVGTGADTDKVLNGIAGIGANFSLIIGDLSYNSVSPESAWCTYIKNHLGSTYPAEILSGNHEDGSPYETYGGSIDTFAGCLPDRIGGLTGTYAHEYYFDYPTTNPIARFILIEPDEYRNGSFVDYSAGTSHYQWVANAIDDARAKGRQWVIVGMHKIYLDMGSYRGDSLDGGDGIGQDLYNLFMSKKVDLVLQAHYHSYQRTKQLSLSSSCSAITNKTYNANCVANSSSTNYTKGAGTVTVINGASGFSIYDIDTSRPEAGYFAAWMGNNVNKSFGYLKINVSSAQLSAQFVPTTGTFTDSFVINATGTNPTPTTAPNPTATPTPKITSTPTPSPTAGPTPTQGSNPIPVGQTGNWNMIFNDEFNGSSVDLSKWRPNWLGSSDTAITNPVNSSETSCYDPAQSTVSNGQLNLSAVARSCNGKNFASGMVQTNGKYNFSYGYMEARMWLPAGTGMWPAFWTDGQNWPTDGEIDVLEAYGNNTCEYHYHYSGCGGDCGPGGSVNINGATSGWHTYAADWEPGVITWYYDGTQVWQQTTGVVSSPHYLIFNLGLESAQSAVPANLKVDYVRVWKKGTGTTTPTPTLIATPTQTPACLADQNSDKTVNLGDLTQILGKWGNCSNCVQDINKDSVVNLADLQFILSLWGKTCP
jgi:hypothetical protein